MRAFYHLTVLNARTGASVPPNASPASSASSASSASPTPPIPPATAAVSAVGVRGERRPRDLCDLCDQRDLRVRGGPAAATGAQLRRCGESAGALAQSRLDPAR